MLSLEAMIQDLYMKQFVDIEELSPALLWPIDTRTHHLYG